MTLGSACLCQLSVETFPSESILSAIQLYEGIYCGFWGIQFGIWGIYLWIWGGISQGSACLSQSVEQMMNSFLGWNLHRAPYPYTPNEKRQCYPGEAHTSFLYEEQHCGSAAATSAKVGCEKGLSIAFNHSVVKTASHIKLGMLRLSTRAESVINALL